MKITVKYFALAAEIAGVEAESLKLAAGATAGDALEAARRLHPRLTTAGFSPLMAVNRHHADRTTGLADGDEVAIFPPVSGG